MQEIALRHKLDALRMARCGACGTERIVTDFMRRDRDSQFTAKPHEPMDEFYCGCQHDPDGWESFL